MWRLGNLPDYWAFFEFVFYAKGGSYFAEPINIQGPIWVTVIIVSWMLTHAYKYEEKYFEYLNFNSDFNSRTLELALNESFDIHLLLKD